MQAYVIACKLMLLHAHGSACILEHSWTFCMHSVTFWNILELSASIQNILEHSCTFCMHSVTFWNILHVFCNILEHSGTFCRHSEHSGTFCMHSGTFCNILEHSGTFCMHSGTFCMHSETFWNILHAHCERISTCPQTDTQTLGLVELRLRS